MNVTVLAKPTEDSHFVDARPSFVVQLRMADVLIEGGAELEIGWLPPLLQNARNPKIEAGRGVDESFPVSETFHDWGLYSQVLWGFKKGWTTGVRGDFLHMQVSAFTDDPERQSRSRVSGDLTWYPTEFSKIRLQYNHDFLEANDFLASREADSIFLQFEFILGAHGAHKF